MNTFYFASLVALLASSATAENHQMTPQGDVANGETMFSRQCVACHVVVNDAGETLAGRTARTGPNLYALPGRLLGSVEGFRYGSALASLGETGQTWDEAAFVGYVQDPTPWLREATGDDSSRGKMSFKVRQESDAYDMYAYLTSLVE